MRRMTKATGTALMTLCAFTVAQSVAIAAEPVATAAQSRPSDKAVEVVKQPFNDLNILQNEIAPVLARAKAAPYAHVSGNDCQALDAEIRELDVALGPDIDLPGGKGASYSKKLTDATFNLARSAVSSVVPYRGVVRQVTGAEKRARSVNEALLAGTVRRAYLKGYGEMLGCQYPASPQRAEHAQANLEPAQQGS